MFIAILQHTPTWVFVLLATLVGLGLTQAFPRAVPLRRVTLLPLAMAGLSLFGVASTFGAAALPLLAWALALAAGFALAQGLADTSAVRWDTASGRLRLPGSWLPLALMLGLFAVKFGVGVTLALHPSLRAAAGFALAGSAAYGFFSGAFLGRAAALWALVRAAAPQGRVAAA